MRMNYSDIKQDIYDHLDQLKESNDPYELLHELADSACPIYYADIISDWQEMPSEFNDSWKEIGAGKDSTITSLMQIDLYEYYHDQYHRIFSKVAQDSEELENDNN